MAMTRKLWSINGLATELDRDRRTVAAALSSVPADGKIGKHKAWFLETALAAFAPASLRSVPAAGRTRSGSLSHFTDRLRDWEEIHSRGSMAPVSMKDAATMLGVEPKNVLLWLRAGLPYATEGDWSTGAGFRFHMAWVLDWTMTLSVVAHLTSDFEGLGKLGLVSVGMTGR